MSNQTKHFNLILDVTGNALHLKNMKGSAEKLIPSLTKIRDATRKADKYNKAFAKSTDKSAAATRKLNARLDRYQATALKSIKRIAKLTGTREKDLIKLKMANKLTISNINLLRLQTHGYKGLAAALKKKTTAQDKATVAGKRYNKTVGSMRGSTAGWQHALGRVRNILLLVTFATVGFRKAIVDSIKASKEMESALLGLVSVASAVGERVSAAKAAAIGFTKDGLMSIKDAAAGLKNLLSAGFGLQEAKMMMEALTDAAAFNRQGTLALGEAVVGATQGIKNQNSIMVDNAGITKNLSVMYKEFEKVVGKTAGTFSEAEKNAAIFFGLMKEAKVYLGNAKLLTTTFEGALSRLKVRTFETQAAFGDALKPALREVLSDVSELIDSVYNLVEAQKGLITDEVIIFYDNFKTAMAPVAILIKSITLGIRSASPVFADLAGALLVTLAPLYAFRKVMKAISGKEVASMVVGYSVLTTKLKAFRVATLASAVSLNSLKAAALWLVGSFAAWATAITVVTAGLFYLYNMQKRRLQLDRRLAQEQVDRIDMDIQEKESKAGLIAKQIYLAKSIGKTVEQYQDLIDEQKRYDELIRKRSLEELSAKMVVLAKDLRITANETNVLSDGIKKVSAFTVMGGLSFIQYTSSLHKHHELTKHVVDLMEKQIKDLDVLENAQMAVKASQAEYDKQVDKGNKLSEQDIKDKAHLTNMYVKLTQQMNYAADWLKIYGGLTKEQTAQAEADAAAIKAREKALEALTKKLKDVSNELERLNWAQDKFSQAQIKIYQENIALTDQLAIWAKVLGLDSEKVGELTEKIKLLKEAKEKANKEAFIREIQDKTADIKAKTAALGKSPEELRLINERKLIKDLEKELKVYIMAKVDSGREGTVAWMKMSEAINNYEDGLESLRIKEESTFDAFQIKLNAATKQYTLMQRLALKTGIDTQTGMKLSGAALDKYKEKIIALIWTNKYLISLGYEHQEMIEKGFLKWVDLENIKREITDTNTAYELEMYQDAEYRKLVIAQDTEDFKRKLDKERLDRLARDWNKEAIMGKGFIKSQMGIQKIAADFTASLFKSEKKDRMSLGKMAIAMAGEMAAGQIEAIGEVMKVEGEKAAIDAAYAAAKQRWAEAGALAAVALKYGVGAGIAYGVAAGVRESSAMKADEAAEDVEDIGAVGGGSKSERRIATTIQAPEVTIYLSPSLTVSGENVFIGSNSIEEFGEQVGNIMTQEIQDAIDSGEIQLDQIGGR